MQTQRDAWRRLSGAGVEVEPRSSAPARAPRKILQETATPAAVGSGADGASMRMPAKGEGGATHLFRVLRLILSGHWPRIRSGMDMNVRECCIADPPTELKAELKAELKDELKRELRAEVEAELNAQPHAKLTSKLYNDLDAGLRRVVFALVFGAVDSTVAFWVYTSSAGSSEELVRLAIGFAVATCMSVLYVLVLC